MGKAWQQVMEKQTTGRIQSVMGFACSKQEQSIPMRLLAIQMSFCDNDLRAPCSDAEGKVVPVAQQDACNLQ